MTKLITLVFMSLMVLGFTSCDKAKVEAAKIEAKKSMANEIGNAIGGGYANIFKCDANGEALVKADAKAYFLEKLKVSDEQLKKGLVSDVLKVACITTISAGGPLVLEQLFPRHERYGCQESYTFANVANGVCGLINLGD